MSKKLAELKGKLSLFDAETDRLTELVNIDSEKYDPWTSREQQAHQSVRNVLVNAISEAESAISDLYTGVDYSSVKSATIPSALTHPASEVVSYFMSLRSTFDSVKDDLKIAVDEYTQDIFEVADIINEKSNQCIQGSKYLLELKSQLADLIDSNAPQTEIDAKEDQIDSHKSNMISSATVLNEDWANFDSFIGNDGTSNRFQQIIELAENLEDIYNETIEYKNQNVDVLKVTVEFSFDAYSGYRILDVFSEIFDKISDRVSNLLDIEDFNPGDGYRRQQIMGERRAIFQSEADITAIMDNYIFTQNPSTGYWELKKDIHPDVVSKYMDYQTNASYITNLTKKHAELKSAQERLNFYITKFEEEGMYKINQIVDQYKKSRRKSKYLGNSRDQMTFGYWTGTQEQMDQRNSLFSSINDTNGLWDARITAFGELKKTRNRYYIHLELFPEFYSTFATLNSTKAGASNDLSIVSAQLGPLQDSVTSTYNFLQTLTETDEEYQAAFTAWESAVAELETYNNYTYPPVEAAYNAAVYAYESYIQGTYDAVGLPARTYTRGGGDLAGYFNENQDLELIASIAEAAVDAAESELQTLEGQMTRSTPTDADKRDRVEADVKAAQAHQINMKFESDYLSGIDTLMYIIYQKINYAKNEAVNITDILPGLTADAMAFITGAFGPDINPLFDSFKKAEFSMTQRNYHLDMANFENDGCGKYGFNSLGVILNPDEISLIDVLNFQNFVLDLSTYATEKYIKFPRYISTLIISEVENGGSSF